MDKLRLFFLKHWLSLLSGGSALAISAVALFWQLGSLLPGFSAAEVAAHHRALSLSAMLNDPVNVPYTALSRLVLELDTHSLYLGRVTTALCGLVVVFLFYWLIQHWHGHRVAFWGTVLFACSTAFLLTARTGTAEVLLFGLFALVAYGVWLKDHMHVKWSLPLGILLASLLLYVPGMIWFLLAGIIWQWQTIAQKLLRTPVWMTIAALLPALALLFPLGWSIAHHPHLAETFIGLPGRFPTPGDILHNLLTLPGDLFFVPSSSFAGTSIAGLLTLDVLAVVLFIFGIYLYGKHFKLSRSLFLLGIAVIGVILVALGGISSMVLLPFVYVVIGGGLAYLIGQWLSVFPRNIFARSTGIALLSILIAFSCIYNLRRYFVAIPNAVETRNTFVQTKP